MRNKETKETRKVKKERGRKRETYPCTIVLSWLHHQGRRGRVRLMSTQRRYRWWMNTDTRCIQRDRLLPATIRRTRNFWTDYTRGILYDLRVRRQTHASQYTARIAKQNKTTFYILNDQGTFPLLLDIHLCWHV